MEREVLEDDRRLALLGELHESLREEMQPLTNAIPLPVSFLIQQAAHDSSISGLFRCESPSSSKVGSLDPPDATKRKARRDHALVGSQDSVQRIFVRVESDRPFRLVCLRSLPPDHEDNLACDYREGAEAPMPGR